jgi:flagellar biosynthesis/type III secretory pathway M-ring protein FliF/YscJ
LRAILSERSGRVEDGAAALGGVAADPAGMPLADMSVSSAALDNFALPQLGAGDSDPVLDSLAREVSSSPKDRLAKIVELDPERAVEVLKQWLVEPAGRAT